MRVTVVGETVVDRIIDTDGTTIEVAGGSASNTAIALQRSGVETSLRARFSRDAAGQALRRHNATEGLDLAASPDVDDPASIVEVRLAPDGQPAYTFRMVGAADWQWTSEELATPLPTGTALVHLGSIASVWQPGADRLRAWVETLQPRPLISFDPNARPAAAVDDHAATLMREGIQRWISKVDFVKVSDEDLRWINSEVPEYEQAARWSDTTTFVVMTRGANGAAVFVDGAHAFDVESVPTVVADTVGAGDTFMAWLIRGVLIALETQSLHTLAHDEAAMRDIVQTASRASAITVSRRGCNPPTLDELAYR